MLFYKTIMAGHEMCMRIMEIHIYTFFYRIQGKGTIEH